MVKDISHLTYFSDRPRPDGMVGLATNKSERDGDNLGSFGEDKKYQSSLRRAHRQAAKAAKALKLSYGKKAGLAVLSLAAMATAVSVVQPTPVRAAEASITMSITNATGGAADGSITIQSPSGGGLSVGSHTLVVNSTAYGGYNVTLNTSADSNNLTSGGNNITPVKGTLSAPTALTVDQTDNSNPISTWGVALPGKAGFDQAEDYTNTNNDAKYAAVPVKGATDNSIMNKTSASAAGGDNQTVVYGVLTGQMTKAGSYQATVTYTATAQLPAKPTITSITPNSLKVGDTTAGANKITINGTALGSAYDVYVDLNGNSQKDTGEECGTLTVTSDNQITCLVPNATTINAGTYDVHVITQGGDALLAKGFSYTKTDPTICSSMSQSSACKVYLDAGLIPITYKGSTSSPKWTVVTDNQRATTSDWYDYSKNAKKWANAVTVTPASAAKYKAAMKGTDTNVQVNESDILGYYVYIPRYAYEVQRRDAKDRVVQAQNFSIKFESVDTPKKTPKACTQSGVDYRTGCSISRDYDTANEDGQAGNTTWATHPAFTFGDQEINGLWVGKYEMTGSSNAPTTKPEQTSFNNQYVGVYYDTANSIGVKDNDVDAKASSATTTQNAQHLDTYTSHMMKNSEWGAVAYLSASEFGAGVNNVQYNNTSYPSTTGRGPSGGAYYTTDGQKASTTSNVYGVYDMSGGNWEYVMGNYTTSNNTINGNGYFNTTNVPAKLVNYYNQSTFTSNSWNGNYSQCTWATCGGQALHETLSVQTVSDDNSAWGVDYSVFPFSVGPWAMRGGYGDSSYSGVFALYNNYGFNYSGYTSRGVLSGGAQ